jgi:hypothetical protein
VDPHAIRNLFTRPFGDEWGTLARRFTYAVLITVIIVLATTAVRRAAERARRSERAREEGILGLPGGRSGE